MLNNIYILWYSTTIIVFFSDNYLGIMLNTDEKLIRVYVELNSKYMS